MPSYSVPNFAMPWCYVFVCICFAFVWDCFVLFVFVFVCFCKYFFVFLALVRICFVFCLYFFCMSVMETSFCETQSERAEALAH